MRALFGAAMAVAFMSFLSGCGDLVAAMSPEKEAAATAVAAPVKPVGDGAVYLLRGGFNIFSTGMDELAAKLRARGVDAQSSGHAVWRQVADQARQHYVATNGGPIVIVGHSWGALGAILMANELEQTNTPVALIILYDTTDPLKIPPNVNHVINLTSSTNIGGPLTVTGEPGFTGKIDQINLPQFDHFNIDNAPSLHEQSIAEILKVIKPNARTATR